MVNGDNPDGTQRLKLTESERHELLSDSLRRETVSVLDRAEAPLTLQDLSHTVWTTSDARDERQGPSSVEVVLHHNHLPKLADYGLVTYDASENTIVENHVDDAFDL